MHGGRNPSGMVQVQQEQKEDHREIPLRRIRTFSLVKFSTRSILCREIISFCLLPERAFEHELSEPFAFSAIAFEDYQRKSATKSNRPPLMTSIKTIHNPQHSRCCWWMLSITGRFHFTSGKNADPPKTRAGISAPFGLLSAPEHEPQLVF